jgi:hypothetical protein
MKLVYICSRHILAVNLATILSHSRHNLAIRMQIGIDQNQPGGHPLFSVTELERQAFWERRDGKRPLTLGRPPSRRFEVVRERRAMRLLRVSLLVLVLASLSGKDGFEWK